MFKTIIKRWKIVLGWGIVFALLSAVVSLFMPMQYSAESQVLVISRDRTGVDPYTQAKSAEQIGENLAQVMKTPDFFAKVMSLDKYSFNKDSWKNLSEQNQRKRWARDAQVVMTYGTGLMNIKVYRDTKEDAAALAGAITETVITRGWEYLGGDVALKLVSPPLASKWPARPNILFNAAAGFVVGVLLAGLWVIRYKKSAFSLPTF